MQTDIKSLILDVLANDSEVYETFELQYKELNQIILDGNLVKRSFIAKIIKSFNSQGLINEATAINYLHFIEDLNAKKQCTTPMVEFKQALKTEVFRSDIKPWVVYLDRETVKENLESNELETMDKAVSSVKLYMILNYKTFNLQRDLFEALRYGKDQKPHLTLEYMNRLPSQDSLSMHKSIFLLKSKLLYSILKHFWIKQTRQGYDQILNSSGFSRTDFQLDMHSADLSDKSTAHNNTDRPSINRKLNELKKYRLLLSLKKLIDHRIRSSYEAIKHYDRNNLIHSQMIAESYQKLVMKAQSYRQLSLKLILNSISIKPLRTGFARIRSAFHIYQIETISKVVTVSSIDTTEIPSISLAQKQFQFSEYDESPISISFGMNSKNQILCEINEESNNEEPETESKNYDTEEYRRLKSKYFLSTLTSCINKTRREAFTSIINQQSTLEDLKRFKDRIINQAQFKTERNSADALKKITFTHISMILTNKLNKIKQATLDHLKSQYLSSTLSAPASKPRLLSSSKTKTSRNCVPFIVLMLLSYAVLGLGVYKYTQNLSDVRTDQPLLIKLNDSTFEQMITENEYVSVFITKQWCVKCFSPFMEYDNAASFLFERGSNVVFTYMKEDKITAVEEKYGISTFPTLLLFHNGQVVVKHQTKIDSKRCIELISKQILEE